MKNIFNSIPFIPFQNAIGKKIVKIGICPDKNTCRVLLDDGSLLWVQSVGGEQYILRHALDAAIIEPSEEARQLSESSHVEWFSFLTLR